MNGRVGKRIHVVPRWLLRRVRRVKKAMKKQLGIFARQLGIRPRPRLCSFSYPGGQILVDDVDSFKEETMEGEFFRTLVTEGMTVIDIGAHMGYYTLIAANAVGKTGKVYAFEPNRVNFEILVKNIRKNGYENVTPLTKAVSNINGKVDFYLDSAGSETGSLTESIVKIAKEKIVVDSVRLDDFLDSQHLTRGPDIIKLDAEGAEGMIAEGARKTLMKPNLKVLMEFRPYALKKSGTEPLQLLRTLAGLGFSFRLIDIRGINLGLGRLEKLSLDKLSENITYSTTGFMDLLLEK